MLRRHFHLLAIRGDGLVRFAPFFESIAQFLPGILIIRLYLRERLISGNRLIRFFSKVTHIAQHIP